MIKITIDKPLTHNYFYACSIDGRKLLQAVKKGTYIELTLKGVGVQNVNPRLWADTAYLVERKRVNFKTPMVFVYNKTKFRAIDYPLNQISLL